MKKTVVQITLGVNSISLCKKIYMNKKFLQFPKDIEEKGRKSNTENRIEHNSSGEFLSSYNISSNNLD